jgi:hypothetical protein
MRIPLRCLGTWSAGGATSLLTLWFCTVAHDYSGEVQLTSNATMTPSNFLATPSAYYRAVYGTPSPSLKYHGVPEAHCTPPGNIGITPARIMGPHPLRDPFL